MVLVNTIELLLDCLADISPIPAPTYTGRRLKLLPLAIGMPVMITTNIDVAGGIVKGRAGGIDDVNAWA